MTATRKHLAGLELALERWNDGGPAIQYGKLLSELIEQAQSAPEPVQGEAVEVVANVSTMGFGKHFAMGIGESINKLTPGDELMAVAQHQRIMAAELEHATNRKQGQSSHVSVSRELLEKVCDPKSSTNRQEGRKSIRTLLKEREPAGQYNHKRIGWELERTAMGDGYYGNALRVAKDIPGLTDQDRAVLDRYATGAQHGTDHIALQDIAMRVYAAQGEGEDQ